MQRFQMRLEKPVILRFGRVMIFCLLVMVEIFILVNNWRANFVGIPARYVLLPASFLLIAENAVKFFALKKFRAKIACYVLDTVCLISLTVFSEGSLISTMYMLILSEFYLSQQELTGSIAMGVVSIGLFLIAFAVSSSLRGESVNISVLIANAFNDIVLLVLHFFIVNFSLQIYRKNREITEAMEELNDSNEKLQKANRDLQEVTALEERQRIAKDIHDTAGHSMTTVIMLTEAAKLILSTDPDEAFRKISAANLQAKNALEELRESVHLLSGAAEQLTLKQMLENIIHDTTDGTGIVIRSEIAEITLCDAKRRFICNTLKEGISNGLRHGNATAFWFELKADSGRIEFLLSDNGKGMEIAEFKEGFGLKGMHDRAESLGGSVWFDTEPDGGFEIHLTLPKDGKERSAL